MDQDQQLLEDENEDKICGTANMCQKAYNVFKQKYIEYNDILDNHAGDDNFESLRTNALQIENAAWDNYNNLADALSSMGYDWFENKYSIPQSRYPIAVGVNRI